MSGNHTPTPWAVWNVPVVNDKFHRKLGPMIILTGHDDDIVFAAEAVNSYASSQAEIEKLRKALSALLIQALQSPLNSPAHEWGWEAIQDAIAAVPDFAALSGSKE